MRIERIKIGELQNFVNSEQYRQLIIKPISIPRALSYIQNPRAEKEDVVLYLLFIENDLQAYRTILPDRLFVGQEEFKFGWLSGNFVKQESRRKGYSTRLLEEAEKDWNGHLLYTNYALESKMVYDKSNKFNLLRSYAEVKFYTRFDLAGIMQKRNSKFKSFIFMLKFIDSLGNALLGLFIRRMNVTQNSDILDFIPDHTFDKKGFTSRGADEFNWILKHPWIKTDEHAKKEQSVYHFSVHSKIFENKLIHIPISGDGQYFWIVIRDKKLFIPYCWNINKKDLKIFAEYIFKLTKDYKIAHLMVNQPELIVALKKYPNRYIISKKRERNYFIHKEFHSEFKDHSDLHFDAGDGDIVFTI